MAEKKIIMIKSVSIIFVSAVCLSLFSLGMQACSLKGMQLRAEAPRITKEELKALLDDPNTIIIDVRQEGDWQQSDRKIKGAVHEDPMNEEESWAGKYPKDKNIVLYCA
jgi:predicted sulfurtransferase